jgi:hypothetical protein
MVGTTVSHYQVIGTIGTGGMAVVYLEYLGPSQ